MEVSECQGVRVTGRKGGTYKIREKGRDIDKGIGDGEWVSREQGEKEEHIR